MSGTIEDSVRTTASLLDTSTWLYVAAAGAGAGLQDTLWRVPGCSKFLAGCVFPYAREEVDRFVGHSLSDGYASRMAAVQLAAAAYLRACVSKYEALARAVRDNDPSASVIRARESVGLGVAAAVAGRTQFRGEHRAHVAVVSRRGVSGGVVYLKKGEGAEQRRRDGQTVDSFALAVLMRHVTGQVVPWGGDFSAVAMISLDGEVDYARRSDAVSWTLDRDGIVDRNGLLATALTRSPLFLSGAWTSLFSSAVWTTLSAAPPEHHVYLPCSLNPLHAGHQGMAETVERETRKRCVYVLSTEPRHGKPVLSAPEQLDRVAQVLAAGNGRGVLLTRAALYSEMATEIRGAFPESKEDVEFVVGVDAVRRMLNQKWYGLGTVAERDADLEKFTRLRTKFYVFGRRDEEDRWVEPDDFSCPVTAWDLFLPRRGFRWDMSSTELRDAAEGKPKHKKVAAADVTRPGLQAFISVWRNTEVNIAQYDAEIQNDVNVEENVSRRDVLKRVQEVVVSSLEREGYCLGEILFAYKDMLSAYGR